MKATPSQLAAIESDFPLTFCVAGAGSGKTKTLIWRIEHMIDVRGIEPEKIVAITFTNNAAREIQKRLGSRRIGFIGTLHSFMLRLLRQHSRLVGYKPAINVLDEEESEAFLVKISLDQKFTGTDKELEAAVLMGPPEKTERFTKARLVAAAYYAELRRNNLMTFDSILIFGLEVCRHLKLNGGLPYSCFLVDEVQDSSATDFKIYGALLGERFFVGDPDQSIYGFRGGDVSHCLKMAEVAKVITLEDNFRCGARICNAAQRLVEHNAGRYPKVTRSATGFPGSVEVRSYSDPSTEAAGIANTIATTDVERNEIAVLFRTNDLVQEYANHMRAVGIPVAERVYKERPDDFWKTKVLLAFLNNPDDDYVARKWLDLFKIEEPVSRIVEQAASRFQTLNQYHLRVPNPFPIGLLPKHMMDCGISAESHSLIMQIMADLPDDVTIGDLILSIGSQDAGEDIGQGVTVSTIHAAKGREWGLVFLPAFEQGVLPLLGKKNPLEEERRLAYVGMTRAKNSLVISHARLRVSSEDRSRMKRQPSFHPSPGVAVASQFIGEAGLPLTL